MKIKCKCGNEVAEGEIVLRKNNRGNEHKALDLYEKQKGIIIKNNTKYKVNGIKKR